MPSHTQCPLPTLQGLYALCYHSCWVCGTKRFHCWGLKIQPAEAWLLYRILPSDLAVSKDTLQQLFLFLHHAQASMSPQPDCDCSATEGVTGAQACQNMTGHQSVRHV